MSYSTSVDAAPVALISVEPVPGVSGPAPGGPIRPRRRFWLLLVFTLVLGVLLSPPTWHFLLRTALIRLAARHGGTLTIDRLEGGPFDPVQFYDVRWHQRGVPTGTDLRVAHAEWTPAWRFPFFQKSPPARVQRLVLAGVSGRWDLATPPDNAESLPTRRTGVAGRWLDRLAARLVPTEFYVSVDEVVLQRKAYRLRTRGLLLSVARGAVGGLLARTVEIAGPGFENTFLHPHGQTLWQGSRLSVGGVDFAPGVRLVNATLDGAHLDRHRLDWECHLAAADGEVRGQGAINFVHPRLALEVAGSLRRMPVEVLARLAGLAGPAGGVVEQGSFSFRGDPEDWPAAEMWLAAQATDFRWGARDWQNLELRATVLHRRIQIRRLELQQSRNRLSLTGECPLFSPGPDAGRWWEAGFACNVDARLDDLHALGQLFGGLLPALDGRMSVNGTLEAAPGRAGINGYLNIEGSRLTVRCAPLDYLHSTLLFRGNELSVADVQATRGEDYFSGRGSVNLAGTPGYQGELHLAMIDPDVYVPALAGLIDLERAGVPVGDLATPVRLEGVFFGPDAEGKPVFCTFGDGSPPPGLP